MISSSDGFELCSNEINKSTFVHLSILIGIFNIKIGLDKIGDLDSGCTCDVDIANFKTVNCLENKLRVDKSWLFFRVNSFATEQMITAFEEILLQSAEVSKDSTCLIFMSIAKYSQIDQKNKVW